MKGLSGKTVIVTGGGGGIGRAVCLRFAEEGSLVAVLDRDASAAQTTVDLVTEAGGKAKAYAADITDYAAIVSTVAAIENVTPFPSDEVVGSGGRRGFALVHARLRSTMHPVATARPAPMFSGAVRRKIH